MTLDSYVDADFESLVARVAALEAAMAEVLVALNLKVTLSQVNTIAAGLEDSIAGLTTSVGANETTLTVQHRQLMNQGKTIANHEQRIEALEA